ncbi:MAG: serine hydrolase, partial [Gemmatimonadota bacterium]|nr:serine hydrolase [Gemmatimonadota bacterium]
GFAATSHGNPFEYRMVYDSAFGYAVPGDPAAWDGWRERTLVGEVNDGNAHHAFGGVAGHAGLFSTAGELDVLLRLLLRRGVHDGRAVIASAVVDQFLAQAMPGQALGWQSPEGAPHGTFAHTGFTGTWVVGVPALDLSLVLLTNRQNGGVDEESRYPDVDPLRRQILAAFLAAGA